MPRPKNLTQEQLDAIRDFERGAFATAKTSEIPPLLLSLWHSLTGRVMTAEEAQLWERLRAYLGVQPVEVGASMRSHQRLAAPTENAEERRPQGGRGRGRVAKAPAVSQLGLNPDDLGD